MWRQSLHAITGMFKITSLMNPLKATRVSFFRSSTAFGFGKSLVSISSVLKLKTNYLPHTSAQLHSVEEVLLIYERSKSFNPGFKDFDGGKNWEISVIFLKNYSRPILKSALYNTSRCFCRKLGQVRQSKVMKNLIKVYNKIES